jgi:hypothetical protein
MYTSYVKTPLVYLPNLCTDTTGKPEFAVRENLCRAFSFGRTVESFFAVRFIQGARQIKSAR